MVISIKAIMSRGFILSLLAIGAPAVLPAAEAPRPGGELVFAVGEIPPSFDGHREKIRGA